MSAGTSSAFTWASSSANWVPWTFVGYLPSKEEVAAGASWLRCDAAFPETWAFDSARTTTVAAHGLAYDHPQDFWACLDQPPTKSEQPFVSCDQPHAYEQTGTLAILNGITQYPSAAELAAEARKQCRLGVPPGYRNVSVTAVWDPRSTLKQRLLSCGTVLHVQRRRAAAARNVALPGFRQ